MWRDDEPPRDSLEMNIGTSSYVDQAETTSLIPSTATVSGVTIPQHLRVPSSENQSTFASTIQATDRFIRSRTESTIDESDTPIIQAVMDRIEDEVEAHAYEELVPLDVKLAIEDHMFGWSHLSSSILGHVCYTLAAYWITYEICTVVFLQVLPDHDEDLQNQFQALRTIFSLCAAIGAFRVVRRRRKVWFRNAYGSSAYKKDAKRRNQMVTEIDQTTTLGRLVQDFRHKRVLRKLKTAENQFVKRHSSIKDEIARQLSGSLASSSESSSDAEKQSLLHEIEGDNSFTSCDSDDLLDFDADQNDTLATPKKRTPNSKKRRRLHPNFHTRPTHRMHSVGHDEILMKDSIRKMPYSHGGFFGAAPFMLSNPHWVSILRYLMPDVYVEISRRVAGTAPSRLIHWAENNPVVAAYGIAHTLEQEDFLAKHNRSGKKTRSLDDGTMSIPNIEWDVFLDPALVKRVELVLDQQKDFYEKRSSGEYSAQQAEQIEAYYRRELKKRSQLLVDKMLIAHGNSIQLIMEQLNVKITKSMNYSRVKRTRRTLGGGIYAHQWLAVFAEALRLGVSHFGPSDDSPSKTKSPKSTPTKRASSLLALAETSCPETTMAESIAVVERICESKNPLGLVLDIKSRHIPHRIWAIVVDTLRSAGVRVEGIASFFIEEIRGLSHLSLTGRVQEVVFCHSAGDIQEACHQGKIRRGDQVFFNGGSLVTSTMSPTWTERLLDKFDPLEVKDSYRIQPYGLPRTQLSKHDIALLPCLQDYKEAFDLSIGIYVQEFAVDEASFQLLIKLVNENPDLYDMGFSWGGINGITVQGISPGRFTRTDGYWNQRYVGKEWDNSLRPIVAPSHPPSSMGSMQFVVG